MKNYKIQNGLRENKKEILEHLRKNIKLDKKKVLEIGCFIGDLLFTLKKEYNCKVNGVEPSSLACKFAHNKFNLKVENTTFARSKKFNMSKTYKNYYDLIIVDDVLSWMDRSLILQTISSIDSMLKTGGYIFLRDFSPNNSFAVRNRHWKNEKIFNFKQANGHKTYFLNSGMYTIIDSNIYQTSKYNKAKAKNIESNLWNDVILKKEKKFLIPITAL
jgi:cyclopropane fatty-acyl-phospholipid synthase-like methyltransferase